MSLYGALVPTERSPGFAAFRANQSARMQNGVIRDLALLGMVERHERQRRDSVTQMLLTRPNDPELMCAGDTCARLSNDDCAGKPYCAVNMDLWGLGHVQAVELGDKWRAALREVQLPEDTTVARLIETYVREGDALTAERLHSDFEARFGAEGRNAHRCHAKLYPFQLLFADRVVRPRTSGLAYWTVGVGKTAGAAALVLQAAHLDLQQSDPRDRLAADQVPMHFFSVTDEFATKVADEARRFTHRVRDYYAFLSQVQVDGTRLRCTAFDSCDAKLRRLRNAISKWALEIPEDAGTRYATDATMQDLLERIEALPKVLGEDVDRLGTSLVVLNEAHRIDDATYLRLKAINMLLMYGGEAADGMFPPLVAAFTATPAAGGLRRLLMMLDVLNSATTSRDDDDGEPAAPGMMEPDIWTTRANVAPSGRQLNAATVLTCERTVDIVNWVGLVPYARGRVGQRVRVPVRPASLKEPELIGGVRGPAAARPAAFGDMLGLSPERYRAATRDDAPPEKMEGVVRGVHNDPHGAVVLDVLIDIPKRPSVLVRVPALLAELVGSTSLRADSVRVAYFTDERGACHTTLVTPGVAVDRTPTRAVVVDRGITLMHAHGTTGMSRTHAAGLALREMIRGIEDANGSREAIKHGVRLGIQILQDLMGVKQDFTQVEGVVDALDAVVGGDDPSGAAEAGALVPLGRPDELARVLQDAREVAAHLTCEDQRSFAAVLIQNYHLWGKMSYVDLDASGLFPRKEYRLGVHDGGRLPQSRFLADLVDPTYVVRNQDARLYGGVAAQKAWRLTREAASAVNPRAYGAKNLADGAAANHSWYTTFFYAALFIRVFDAGVRFDSPVDGGVASTAPTCPVDDGASAEGQDVSYEHGAVDDDEEQYEVDDEEPEPVAPAVLEEPRPEFVLRWLAKFVQLGLVSSKESREHGRKLDYWLRVLDEAVTLWTGTLREFIGALVEGITPPKLKAVRDEVLAAEARHAARGPVLMYAGYLSFLGIMAAVGTWGDEISPMAWTIEDGAIRLMRSARTTSVVDLMLISDRVGADDFDAFEIDLYGPGGEALGRSARPRALVFYTPPPSRQRMIQVEGRLHRNKCDAADQADSANRVARYYLMCGDWAGQATTADLEVKLRARTSRGMAARSAGAPTLTTVRSTDAWSELVAHTGAAATSAPASLPSFDDLDFSPHMDASSDCRLYADLREDIDGYEKMFASIAQQLSMNRAAGDTAVGGPTIVSRGFEVTHETTAMLQLCDEYLGHVGNASPQAVPEEPPARRARVGVRQTGRRARVVGGAAARARAGLPAGADGESAEMDLDRRTEAETTAGRRAMLQDEPRAGAAAELQALVDLRETTRRSDYVAAQNAMKRNINTTSEAVFTNDTTPDLAAVLQAQQRQARKRREVAEVAARLYTENLLVAEGKRAIPQADMVRTRARARERAQRDRAAQLETTRDEDKRTFRG